MNKAIKLAPRRQCRETIYIKAFHVFDFQTFPSRNFLIIDYQRDRPLAGRYRTLRDTMQSACIRARVRVGVASRGNRGVESSCKELRLSPFLCRTRDMFHGGPHTRARGYIRFLSVCTLVMARERHGMRDNNTGKKKRKKQGDLPPTWRNRADSIYIVS